MTGQKPPVLALILAGGLGRRMGGSSKPLLDSRRRSADRPGRFAPRERNAQPSRSIFTMATPEALAPFAGSPRPAVARRRRARPCGPLAGVLGWPRLRRRQSPGFERAAQPALRLPLSCRTTSRRGFRSRGENRGAASPARRRAGACIRSSRCGQRPCVKELRRALVDGTCARSGNSSAITTRAQVEWSFTPHDPFFNVNTPDDLVAGAGMADDEARTMKKLDLRGLKCPLPVLKTRKVLAGMAPGEQIEVACTDPLSVDRPAQSGARDRRRAGKPEPNRGRPAVPDPQGRTGEADARSRWRPSSIARTKPSTRCWRNCATCVAARGGRVGGVVQTPCDETVFTPPISTAAAAST